MYLVALFNAVAALVGSYSLAGPYGQVVAPAARMGAVLDEEQAARQGVVPAESLVAALAE
ncbi:MAG: hypothetical protein ACR2QS_04125 [Woeseiaceae bacterium]